MLSTVPAAEVARLRYANLPSSSGLFPSTLLDSALHKMHAASNDALVHRTLHQPKIPRISSAGPSKAGSSSTSLLTMAAPLPWCVGRSTKRRQPPPLPLPSKVGSNAGAKVRCRFQQLQPLRWQTPECQVEVLLTGFRLYCGWELPVSALEALAGSWSRILGAVLPVGRIPLPLQGLSSSHRSRSDIVSDISLVTGLVPGGQGAVVQGCLGNSPRSGSRLLQSSFPGGKDSSDLASRGQPLSLERVC